jgi:WG containing repeat
MTTTHLFPIFVRQGKSRTRFKVGYIDHKGKVVIDPIFDEGTRFYEELAAVRVENRWGVINASGDFVIQPRPWAWCRFREGLASISVKGKWGIIDRNGNFVVEPRYDYLEPFREGVAAFKIGEGEKARYGFLDKSGTDVIPAKFHDAKGFSEGLAAVKVANLWGYILPSGIFQITPRFDGTGSGKRWPDTRAGYFVNRMAPVWSGPDRYRFIDTTGCFAFEGGFDDATSFCENRAVVGMSKRYGFIGLEGRIVIECRFTLARDFSEGLARVQEIEPRVGFSPLSGFINVEGQMVIQPKFYSADSFRNGLSLVTTQDSIGYINMLGEFVWQGPFVEHGTLC